ncbi:hypothetical protein [Cupriavidus gilardii]|uniref:hypothetical protein n=1 Tax=Cupriavidus gilardii TaxID=82541 RepID=UPI001EE5BE86|nr:hypothetical protein [Cupriavidus gilardii]MCG5261314.1 hypothetical protein [Cupriavidus gilardii]
MPTPWTTGASDGFEEHVLQWISDHSQLITALTGVGTLLVWVIYLQVFVSSYRRQLRATLLITRGPGEGLAARCFVTNMSAGPVYVQSVIVEVEAPQRTLVMPATEIHDAERDAHALQRTRQGPLQPAQIRDIGSFDRLIAPALREIGDRAEGLQASEALEAVTITVVGVYGSEDLPIGARRRFALAVSGDKVQLHGATIETEQIRRRSERQSLLADLRRDQ